MNLKYFTQKLLLKRSWDKFQWKFSTYSINTEKEVAKIMDLRATSQSNLLPIFRIMTSLDTVRNGSLPVCGRNCSAPSPISFVTFVRLSMKVKPWLHDKTGGPLKTLGQLFTFWVMKLLIQVNLRTNFEQFIVLVASGQHRPPSPRAKGQSVQKWCLP